MTYLSLDVWGPHRWSSRHVALGRHPVAEIHSTPCAVRCLNARRNQRHKIQSSTRPARSSWRTGWRGALPLLPRRFIHQELPSCVESRVKRWRNIVAIPRPKYPEARGSLRKASYSQFRTAFSLMILSTHLYASNMLQWHHGSEAQKQHTHACSFYLLLQMRTSSDTKQERWKAPAGKKPCSLPQSGSDQHANECSDVALPKKCIQPEKRMPLHKKCVRLTLEMFVAVRQVGKNRIT